MDAVREIFRTYGLGGLYLGFRLHFGECRHIALRIRCVLNECFSARYGGHRLVLFRVRWSAAPDGSSTIWGARSNTSLDARSIVHGSIPMRLSGRSHLMGIDISS